MAISSLADYESAFKEYLLFNKVTPSGNLSAQWWSMWDRNTIPAAGSFSIGNTANGVVPTDATTGAPTINFSSGTGYITWVDVTDSMAQAPINHKFALYDRLFHAGSYAYNASTTLASQPSYSSRVPGSDYNGLQIWLEVATTYNGSPTVTVTYTNQSGTTGRSTGSVALGSAPEAGRMILLPLQSGDCGVQTIESVTGTGTSLGAFNIVVVRPLLWVRGSATSSYQLGIDHIGMPIVYSDSCLALMHYWTSGGGTATFTGTVEIASA